jgi:ribosomal-protein-alanine N-acetyltransferase
MDLHRLLADEKAMRYLPELHDKTREGALQNLQEALRENGEPQRNKWFFAVLDRTTLSYIGEIGYTVREDSPVGKVVQLGYFIRPEYWGKGLVTEAAREVLSFAFTQGHVFKVESGCLRENSASERILRKLGMVREAELLAHTLHEGTLKDRVEYRLLKTEWQERQASAAFTRAGKAERAVSLKREPTCRPKAILFDYGQTLIDEFGFDAWAGTEAVLREAVDNPQGTTAQEVQTLADALLHEVGRRGLSAEQQHPRGSG